MNEYRLITFCNESGKFFSGIAGNATKLDIDFLGSLPEVAQAMDGWEPISFQLIPQNELTYLSILLRINQVPENLR